MLGDRVVARHPVCDQPPESPPDEIVRIDIGLGHGLVGAVALPRVEQERLGVVHRLRRLVEAPCQLLGIGVGAPDLDQERVLRQRRENRIPGVVRVEGVERAEGLPDLPPALEARLVGSSGQLAVIVEPKEAVIRLAEDVTGVLKASEISIDRIEDARNVLTAGEEVEVKIVSVDRKNRNLALSIKAKEVDDEREAVREHRRQESERVGPSTLGDLIKAQMDQGES